MNDPSPRPDPGLHVVGTPIGNLGDITLRALEVLRGADLILAEDTRVTRRLLSRYDVHVPLWSYHAFNEAARLDGVLARLQAGEVVALVTDAGMPGVSDPGARIVRACREAGVPVTAAPGPSAVVTALALAGLDEAGWMFGGFPPAKPGKRRKALEGWLSMGVPVVVYESPHRVAKFMADLDGMQPDAQVFVAREITKRHEETGWGRPAEWQSRFVERPPRGEFTLILVPGQNGAVG